MKLQMTHNEYVEFMKANASRLYTEKGYSMADYNRDCDNVEVLPFDLARFGLDFTEEQLRIINAYFTEESVSRLGNMRLAGHLLNSSEYAVANTLGIDMVASGSYSGFGKSDVNKCLFEFCEGDIYLILCETDEDYKNELKSYFEFYEVHHRVFVEGSFNLYRDGNGVDSGAFVGKAFSEKEVKKFILDFVKQHPEGFITVTKDVKNGYNDSSLDYTNQFLHLLDGRLPYAEDNACVEVYFDGILMDNVYTSMDKAEALVSTLVQNGYSDYNGDVKEDWVRSGGRANPDLSFRVVPYEAEAYKSVVSLIASASERCCPSETFRARDNELEPLR